MKIHQAREMCTFLYVCYNLAFKGLETDRDLSDQELSYQGEWPKWKQTMEAVWKVQSGQVDRFLSLERLVQ